MQDDNGTAEHIRHVYTNFTRAVRMFNVYVKVKLALCLTKYHCLKTYPVLI